MTSEPSPCPALPPGWKRETVIRKSGASAGHCDVYYYSPSGRKCRSKQEMLRYLDNDVDLADFNYSSGHMVARQSNKVKQCQQKRAAAMAKLIAKVPGRRKSSLLALKLKKARGIWRPVYECRKTTSTSDTDAAPANKKHKRTFTVMEQRREHSAKQVCQLEELEQSTDSQKDFMAALNNSYPESVHCEKDFMAALNKNYPEMVDSHKDILVVLNKMYTEQEHLHPETPSQHLGKKLGEDETMSQHLGKLGEDAAEIIHSDLTTPQDLDGIKALKATRGRNSELNIKRPLNAFMLWATNERRKKAQNSAIFSKILGSRWKSMTDQEKQPWFEEQVRVRKVFMEKYPDYKFKLKRKKGTAVTDKKLHMGRLGTPKQRIPSQRQKMGQSFSAGRGPSSYHKVKRKAKEVHMDSNLLQVGNASQHDAGMHPNNPPQYMQVRAVTNEVSVSPIGGNDNEMHEDSAAKVNALSLVRTMTWTRDELRMWIEHQSKALVQSEDFPATDIVTELVSLYWGGSIAELTNELRGYSGQHFFDEVSEFCSKHITSDTVILSHVLCSWGKIKDGYRVLDHDYVHTEAAYTSSWLNINEQLDDIDKEFSFPPFFRCALERDKQSTESDYETSEKEDVLIQNSCSVETTTDSSDPFSSLKIHVLPSDKATAFFKQECSYQAKSKMSAVQSEKLFSGSVVNDLCEMANNSKSNSDGLEIKSAMAEYCRETMAERCTDVRETIYLKNYEEIPHFVSNADPKSISLPNTSSLGHPYRSSIAERLSFNNNIATSVLTSHVEDSCGRPEQKPTDRGDISLAIEEGQTPPGFRIRNESSGKKLAPGDTPDKAGCEFVDTTVKLALFGSDSGKRVVNGKGITRANCSQVFFPPQILTVIDTPVMYQIFRDPFQSSPAFDSLPKRGRPRKNPTFVKSGSWWCYNRPRHVFPYNP